MLYIPVYQEWINEYIPILFGDRNIGIAYSYYVWVLGNILRTWAYLILSRAIKTIRLGSRLAEFW